MSSSIPCTLFIFHIALAGSIACGSQALGAHRTCIAAGADTTAVRARIQAGWGANYLTSPGNDIQSLPGRTGYSGIALDIAGKGRMRFQPAINYTAAAYRSSLAYRIWFVSTRTAVDLDLLLGFPQMNRTILQFGVFGGRTMHSNAAVEQKGQSNFGGFGLHGVRAGHHPTTWRSGVVLGLSIPLGIKARLGLDIRFRQHIIPLVESDQYHALINQGPQQVLATNTRASELTFGLGYLLN